MLSCLDFLRIRGENYFIYCYIMREEEEIGFCCSVFLGECEFVRL